MARERWPKARRSSGANQRALRSVSGFFFAVMATPVRDLHGLLTGRPCGASPAFAPARAGVVPRCPSRFPCESFSSRDVPDRVGPQPHEGFFTHPVFLTRSANLL